VVERCELRNTRGQELHHVAREVQCLQPRAKAKLFRKILKLVVASGKM
jgi:hypothetical protein